MPYLESVYSMEVQGDPTDAVSPGIVSGFAYNVEQGKVNLVWNELTETEPVVGDLLQGEVDGVNQDFYVAHAPIIGGTLTVYVDAVPLDTAEYSVELSSGLITLNTAPSAGSSVTADYTAELTDLSYYRIYRRRAGEQTWQLAAERSAYTADATPQPITEYQHILLADGTEDGASFEYAISGVDDDSNEGQKTVAMLVKTIPSVPTGLRRTVGDGRVQLYWDDMRAGGKNPNLQGYNVYRSTQSGGPYTLIAETVAGTSYLDLDVTNGTTYYYVVTSHDDSV